MPCVVTYGEDSNNHMAILRPMSIDNEDVMKIGEVGRAGQEQRDLRQRLSHH